MTYFTNVNTLEELRSQYKQLLKKHHPDNGGSEEVTKIINLEYEQLFKLLKDEHQSQTFNNANQNKTSFDSMRWNEAEDELLRDILSKIIHLSDITIEIIGNWVWIGGNSYQHRAELKTLGFKFAGNKKMWYWHSKAFRKKSHKKLSINDIRSYYGTTNVNIEQYELLQA